MVRILPTLRPFHSALLPGLSAAAAAARAALTLDPQQRDWLQAHPELRLCVDPDWMPCERLGAEGRHQALIAGYMALFQRRSLDGAGRNPGQLVRLSPGFRCVASRLGTRHLAGDAA